MSSENPTGADNQQETNRYLPIIHPMWIVGQVYQHRDHRETLDGLVRFFGCGKVRPKGPASAVDTYSVWALRDLLDTVIPFFELNPLRVKAKDFERFRRIVIGLDRHEHWSRDGFERLVRLAFSMNANGKQRARTIEQILEGSSETARQA